MMTDPANAGPATLAFCQDVQAEAYDWPAAFLRERTWTVRRPPVDAESLAAAATSGLDNLYFHVDWNQASIDSNTVTREGGTAGEYVQWDPCEFLLMHGFNVIYVPDGFDFAQIREAQKRAEALDNGRPTGIVYRTVKGWQYGIEGCKSHGAGHGFYSPEYLESLRPFEEKTGVTLPRFDGEKTADAVEQAFDTQRISGRRFGGTGHKK